MFHAKFQNHRPSDFKEKYIRLFFFYLYPWRLSWSCDLEHLYKHSFSLPNDAPQKVWLTTLAVSEKNMLEFYGQIHVRGLGFKFVDFCH